MKPVDYIDDEHSQNADSAGLRSRMPVGKVWLAGGGIVILIALLSTPNLSTFGSSEGEIAAETFHNLQSNWSAEQKCSEAGSVADAFLRDGDSRQYNLWKETETIVCSNAAVCRQIVGGCGNQSG